MSEFTHRVRQVRYNFEYERRIRSCFVGAGGHAFRNIYPALRYAPVDLAAVCDLDIERAQAIAKTFGAAKSYSDTRAMFAAERPELVFIVTGYLSDGRPASTDIALAAMEAGAHVWMEKPTAATAAEIAALKCTSARTGRLMMTGFKKTFFPTIEKLKELIGRHDFGKLTSIAVRYPERLPPVEDRADLNRMQHFLDHICHPGSILHFLAGDIDRGTYEADPLTGTSVATFRFHSGAVGSLHLTGGMSWGSPLERVEITGEGANAIVENGTHLTFYRRAELPAYGRAASFIQPEENAALVFETERSLGQLYNNNLFYLGYVPEILHLTDAILDGTPLERGTLAVSEAMMRLFDFYRLAPAGEAWDFGGGEQ